MLIKLRSKRFSRSNSKLANGKTLTADNTVGNNNKVGEIRWELRPGGMLVQKRECAENVGETVINLKVSTVSQWHDVSIQATSTFGELKVSLSMVTGLEPKEQRLLYKGKEREDYEYLHMVGVKDNEKVLLLEDPAIKERKLLSSPYRTISV